MKTQLNAFIEMQEKKRILMIEKHIQKDLEMTKTKKKTRRK